MIHFCGVIWTLLPKGPESKFRGGISQTFPRQILHAPADQPNLGLVRRRGTHFRGQRCCSVTFLQRRSSRGTRPRRWRRPWCRFGVIGNQRVLTIFILLGCGVKLCTRPVLLCWGTPVPVSLSGRRRVDLLSCCDPNGGACATVVAMIECIW